MTVEVKENRFIELLGYWFISKNYYYALQNIYATICIQINQ